MKKVFSVLLPILMVLSFAGCGTGESSSDVNDIGAPESASYFEKKNYKTVVDRFKNAGFTNITTEKDEDLITGWITKDGSVESVAIGGVDDFESGDAFGKDTEVVVRYHTFMPNADSSNEATESSSSEPAAGAETESTDILTPKNNAEFDAALQQSDPYSPVIKAFAEKYEGRVIEFDGFVGASMLHGNYKTRYDMLLDAGDFNPDKSQGPDFRLTSIGSESVYVDGTGSDPSVFPVGSNIHIKATISDYKDDPACIFLVQARLTER